MTEPLVPVIRMIKVRILKDVCGAEKLSVNSYKGNYENVTYKAIFT